MFAARDEDINVKFEAAWAFGGAPFMRQEMSMTLAILELIYHESDIGRQLTVKEQTDRYVSWDIGLDAKTIDDYYLNKQKQSEAAKSQ